MHEQSQVTCSDARMNTCRQTHAHKRVNTHILYSKMCCFELSCVLFHNVFLKFGNVCITSMCHLVVRSDTSTGNEPEQPPPRPTAHGTITYVYVCNYKSIRNMPLFFINVNAIIGHSDPLTLRVNPQMMDGRYDFNTDEETAETEAPWRRQ